MNINKRKTMNQLDQSLIELMLNEQHLPNFQEEPILRHLKVENKIAILMAHFGTTHADTREKTIDAVNSLVKKTYPKIEVREAYTSRIIMKRLRDKGLYKPNLLESLEQLHQEGYTHVVVQPTVIIDGVEMHSIRHDSIHHKFPFREIRVGTPLLYFPQEYFKMVSILKKKILDQETAYIWVGHGTYDPSTAQYSMLEYVCRLMGINNVFVSTIEGFPNIEVSKNQILSQGYKKIRLVPIMFVAGDHAKNDIAEDWREEFEKLGCEVSCSLEGLGEIKEMQEMYLQKLAQTMKYKRWSITDKKKIYRVTGEKMKE